jgi:hypothetical protein
MNADQGAYFSESFHHTRQGLRKVAISDGQFGVDASKRKIVQRLRLGICRRHQEDEIIRAILLDTA